MNIRIYMSRCASALLRHRASLRGREGQCVSHQYIKLYIYLHRYVCIYIDMFMHVCMYIYIYVCVCVCV